LLRKRIDTRVAKIVYRCSETPFSRSSFFLKFLFFASALRRILKVKEDLTMRTFSGKRSTLALAIAGVTALSGFTMAPDAKAEGFMTTHH
jgi:hypothetical protein